tara:strand:+ start:405 stop:653 length:249 start_codon:yes stop_codon:yes gene_type:complete
MTIIRKISTLISTLFIVLVLIGSLFSSNIRLNLFSFFSTLLNNGIVGVIVIITLVWVFRSFPSDVRKLLVSKGNLKKFWDLI